MEHGGRRESAEGGQISRATAIDSLPAMALLALLVLRPIEIHPEAAAGAGLLLVLLALLEVPREGQRDLLVPLTPLAAFLVPLLALNLAISCERHQSLLVLSRWLLLGALAIALVRIIEGGRARALAQLAALLGTAVALFALWQGLYGLRRQAAAVTLEAGPLKEAIMTRLGSGRVFGTFILPASLGGAIAITLPLTVALFAERSRSAPRGRQRPSPQASTSPPQAAAPRALSSRWSAWALAVGVALQAAALLWTISLGAWVALIAASVAVLGARWARDPRRRRLLAIGFLLGVLLLAAGISVRSFLLPRPGIEDRPLSYRIGNWEAALHMFRDAPMTGTGLGTYGNVFPAYRAAEMNESRFAHSTWLQILAELGIGAIPLLLLALLAAGCLLARASAGPLQAAAAVGALAFLVQNTADFTAYQPSVSSLFVLACALALASSRKETEHADGGSGSGFHERGAASHEAPIAAPARGVIAGGPAAGTGASRWIRWAACFVAAGGAGLLLVISGLSDLQREHAMAAHGVDPEGEREHLERSIALDPLDPQPRGDLSRLLSAAPAGSADLAEGRREGAIAAALDPNTPFRRRDLGLIDIKEGRPAEAWTGLAWASFLYPLSREYASDLASLEGRLFAKPTQDGAP